MGLALFLLFIILCIVAAGAAPKKNRGKEHYKLGPDGVPRFKGYR